MNSFLRYLHGLKCIMILLVEREWGDKEILTPKMGRQSLWGICEVIFALFAVCLILTAIMIIFILDTWDVHFSMRIFGLIMISGIMCDFLKATVQEIETLGWFYETQMKCWHGK